MAEIKIEKKGNKLWWWLLAGLIVLALLIYFLARDKDEGREAAVPTITEPATTSEAPATASLLGVRENGPTVIVYVDYINKTKDMGLDHAYTSQALARLNEAIKEMAAAINVDVNADLAQAKQYSEAITEKAFATSHANSIKSATEIQTNALQKMQQARYPELESDVAQLREASNAIKPDVLTLDQKDNIKSFFQKAAELLDKMN